MGDNDNEEKIKLSRAELLAKARKVKAEKAIERQKIINNVNANDDVDKIISSLDNQSKPPPKTFIKKPSKKKDVKVEIKELKFNKENRDGEAEGEGPELVEEVVRIPANRRKKIIKRTIEIEESETDEEVIEEIVKIPKGSKTTKKEVKINKDDIKKKLIEDNKQRLLNELFS